MARCLLGLAVVALVACATPAPPGPLATTPAVPAPAPASVTPTPRASPGHAALERGRAPLAVGDLVPAATARREALRLDGDLVDARVSLGVTLWELGDLDGAVEEPRAGLKRQPDLGEAPLGP